MQNTLHLHDPGHQAVLRRHFGNPHTTIVLGEVPIGWTARQRSGLRIPDLLIAFGINRPLILSEQGYSILRQGKPPDFVLEIASSSTARNDEGDKWLDYARFGIPEYWRFDDQWGRRYDTGLAGDRLVDGAYQPINIHQIDEQQYWGHSQVLNLDLCWQHGALRWYDPIARHYLPTSDEEAAARRTAEIELNAERRARAAAEARLRQLEAENRQLRGQ